MIKQIIFLVLIMAFSSCYKSHKSKDIQKDINNWALLNFKKVDSINPILKPTDDLVFDCPITYKSVKWEERNVLNPSAVVKNDSVYLFYRAQDTKGTSRIGIAISVDGLHFVKRKLQFFIQKTIV